MEILSWRLADGTAVSGYRCTAEQEGLPKAQRAN